MAAKLRPARKAKRGASAEAWHLAMYNPTRKHDGTAIGCRVCNWPPGLPKEQCRCGHGETVHAGATHHGGCRDFCDCAQFTWMGWTPLFVQTLKEVNDRRA